MVRSLHVGSILFVTLAFVTGCGGNGTPAPPLNGTSPNGATQLAVTVDVPVSTAAAKRFKPKYVSASLQSFVVNILSGTTPLVSGNDYVNLTTTGSSGSNSCVTSTNGTISCTLLISAALPASGTYTVVIAAYDQQQTGSCVPFGTPACAGGVLSVSNLPTTITLGGSSTVSVTMGGVPAYVQPVEFVSGLISTTAAGNKSVAVYGPGTKSFELELLDAGRNVIVGAGMPTLTLTSRMPSVVSVSASSAANGIYTIAITPQTTASAAGPIVSPGTVHVDATIAIPNSNGSVAVPDLFDVQVEHSAIYSVEAGGQHGNTYCTSNGALDLAAYLDGNSTPTSLSYCAGTSTLGVTTDVLGNVWLADSYNNALVPFTSYGSSQGTQVFGTPAPGGAPSLHYPGAIAFDLMNDAFVGNANFSNPPYSLVEFPNPNSMSTPSFFGSVTAYQPANGTDIPYSVAVDNGGSSGTTHIYERDYVYPSGYQVLAYDSGSTTSHMLFSASYVSAIAVEPVHQYLWILEGTPNPTAILINPATSVIVASITGLPTSASGIATDMLGNVFIALGSTQNGILEYSPPNYAASTALLTGTADVVNLTMWPNELIGNQTSVGTLPSPLPSAFPIPTPTSF